MDRDWLSFGCILAMIILRLGLTRLDIVRYDWSSGPMAKDWLGLWLQPTYDRPPFGADKRGWVDAPAHGHDETHGLEGLLDVFAHVRARACTKKGHRSG